MAEEEKASTSPEPAGSQAPSKPPEPKVLFYILSFLISLFGIIFGIVYMTKEGEENKKFGKICLIIGIVALLIPCICWLLMVVLGVGGSFLGGAVDYGTTY